MSSPSQPPRTDRPGVRPIPPIIIMGVQGCGKTTIGELLARRLGVPLVDGDRHLVICRLEA